MLVMMWRLRTGRRNGLPHLCCLLAAGLAGAMPARAASVSGVVRDAITRSPLAEVRVHMGSAGATTDSSGRFTLRDVGAGRDWLSCYDERHAGEAGVWVVVKDGEAATEVEIAMRLGGSISGRVLDEDRRPVEGASVLLLERRFESGEAVFGARLATATGDKGEYRLEPVPSDRGYVVLAKRILRTVEDSTDPEKRPRVLPPAQYPETVTLNPSEERREVEIRMASVPAYCVEGVVEAPGGAAALPVAIAERMAFARGATLSPVTVKTDSEGRFRACGFYPGEYTVSASGTEDGRARQISGFAEMTIVDHDVSSLKLRAEPFPAVAGRALWGPPPPGKAAETPVNIGFSKFFGGGQHADEPKASFGIGGGMFTGERVRLPAEFKLRLPGDEFKLDVAPLPPGCYLKEAGWSGVRVRNRPVRIARGLPAGTLEIVIGCDSGSIGARVTDRDGNPVSNIHLYAMPAAADSAAAMAEDLLTGEVDKGWGTVSGVVPPGKYLVLACNVELDGTADPYLKLWQARGRATEVRVGARAAVRVTLEALSIE
jgi:hypothetical protein